MKQIILDTNIILHAIQFKIDINKELNRILTFQYETCILDKTITELNFLEKKKDPKTKLLAKIARHLIKDYKVIKSPKEKVDDSLVELANKDTIIATQDKEVKKQIKTPIIIIRQKTHLELRNYENY